MVDEQLPASVDLSTITRDSQASLQSQATGREIICSSKESLLQEAVQVAFPRIPDANKPFASPVVDNQNLFLPTSNNDLNHSQDGDPGCNYANDYTIHSVGVPVCENSNVEVFLNVNDPILQCMTPITTNTMRRTHATLHGVTQLQSPMTMLSGMSPLINLPYVSYSPMAGLTFPISSPECRSSFNTGSLQHILGCSLFYSPFFAPEIAGPEHMIKQTCAPVQPRTWNMAAQPNLPDDSSLSEQCLKKNIVEHSTTASDPIATRLQDTAKSVEPHWDSGVPQDPEPQPMLREASNEAHSNGSHD